MFLCRNAWLFLGRASVFLYHPRVPFFKIFHFNFKIVSLERSGFLSIQLANGISMEDLLR